MFDPVTRSFLATAPSLPSLPSVRFVDEFTSAYIEIAAARLALAEADDGSRDRLIALSERMNRIADVLEAQVILGVNADKERAAAFVAGSARQVVFQISRVLLNRSPTRVDEFAISSDLAASLLFLIAERTADAYETSRQIDAHGMTGVRGQIAIAVSQLARGNLEPISQLNPERFSPADLNLSDSSITDLLYSKILHGIWLLAISALGLSPMDAFGAAEQAFQIAKELSVEIDTFDTPEADLPFSCISTFPGPHHLAGLLKRAAGTLRDAAVIAIAPPGGADQERWSNWLKSEALRYPFIWENHQRAVETGFLNAGHSMIMTSPTGSGKTTLSTLKIAATLCASKTVVYLAPTHALVNQVERDLNERLASLAVARSVEESLLEEIGQALPPIAVMTPERCFTLLTFASELFKNVGLLVFDECHLMGVHNATTSAATDKVDRRSIDAMLCLLTFLLVNKDADYLLLSAMISNGSDIADWLHALTSRPCTAFDDKWKPTRQLKACVCYNQTAIDRLNDLMVADVKRRKVIPKSVPTEVSRMAKAPPFGLFSGGMGWHPSNPNSFSLEPLIRNEIPLGVARRSGRPWKLTANRNEVAAELAILFQKAGLKVVVFCESVPTTISVARRINEALGAINPTYDEIQQAWRTKLIEELGSVDAVYDAGHLPASVHHGELLLEERLLVEQLFRSRTSGLDVLAATSTLAQGLNLPCEVVILAGTDRIDDSDPQEARRTELKPHEIMNALGRAGRAGLAATGLAIVIPADIITWMSDKSDVSDSSILDMIFADTDQCAPLSDPIAGLYDHIVAHSPLSNEANYLLRRLAVSLSSPRTGIETFDDLTRRSFGFFLRARANATEAEQWLTDRRSRLQQLIEAATEDKERDWIQELAAKSGSSVKFVQALTDAFSTAPVNSPNALDWMVWLVEQLPAHEDDFDAFIRPDDAERVFGRGYTSASAGPDRRQRAREAILGILPAWFSAAPLHDIEKGIVAFIASHEGEVKRATTVDSKAKRARRFALRFASNFSYLAGVLAQIAAKIATASGTEPLAITQSLPQLVRRGFNTPYHLYIDHQTPGQSRQSIDRQFKSLEGRFARLPSDTWDTVRTNWTAASLFWDFGSVSVTTDTRPQIGSSTTISGLLPPPSDDGDETSGS